MQEDGDAHADPVVVAALRRAWWWHPASHIQVWLISSAVGLLAFTIAYAIGGSLGVNAVTAVVATLGFGLSQSYHIGHRK